MTVLAEGRTEVIPVNRRELVQQACATNANILRSSREVIRLKFELGRLVRLALEWEQYQHAAVVQLARELSAHCEKTILPQRLYEAARLYEAFGGEIRRIWELEARLAQPLNYTY